MPGLDYLLSSADDRAVTVEQLALKWLETSISVSRAESELRVARQQKEIREAAVARTKKDVESAVAAADLTGGTMPAIAFADAVRKLREAETAMTDAQDKVTAARNESGRLFEELVAATKR